jgi:RNA polymerase sigma-70 factor (ECF subfamily)
MKDRTVDETFNTLYETYYKQVYYSAFSVIRDHFLAQDVVQETFVKVFRRFNTFKDKAKKDAWLKVISRNTAIDLYRKRLRRQEIFNEHIELLAGAAEDGMERSIGMKIDRQLLCSLQPKHQNALLLIYEYGMTYEQLASYQNTSVSAVKSQLHRAKTKLQSMARETE